MGVEELHLAGGVLVGVVGVLADEVVVLGLEVLQPVHQHVVSGLDRVGLAGSPEGLWVSQSIAAANDGC